MTLYVAAYLFYFAILGININSRFLREWILIASIPMIVLVLLKGMVGVDLAMYEKSIDFIRIVDAYTFTFEPLFEYVILFLAQRVDNSLIILSLLSALTTIFLFFGSFSIEKRPYILAFGIIPYFYLDMTMNGIRYGLAFSIIFYGARFLINGKIKIYLAITIAAALIQLSSILIAGLLYLLIRMRWRILLSSAIGAVFVYLLFSDYLQFKIDANKTLETASATAGIAPLLLSSLTLGVCWMDKDIRKIIGIQIFILAALTIISYIITQVIYAGLRFQQLNLFLIYLFIACASAKNKLYFSKKIVVYFILIGIVSTGFRLKNFYNDAGQGDSPFVPYKFNWEQRD